MRTSCWASSKKRLPVIADKYGDDRRTSIGFDEFDLSMEDLIPEEDVVITMTNLGYIKRMTTDNFKSQNRGGKGIKGMQTIDEDLHRGSADDHHSPLHHVLYQYR